LREEAGVGKTVHGKKSTKRDIEVSKIVNINWGEKIENRKFDQDEKRGDFEMRGLNRFGGNIGN